MIVWHDPQTAMAEAARREYARRHAAWQRMADGAPTRGDARRIAERGDADLRRWAEIIRWLEEGEVLRNPAQIARIAATTRDAAQEAGLPVTDREQFIWLCRLARALDDAAQQQADALAERARAAA